jgi:NitT/TauT family transport system substrate-binding protein
MNRLSFYQISIFRQLAAIVLMMLFVTTAKAQGKFVFMPQWTSQAQFAGYYVAMEKGFYRDAGIEVDIVHPSVTQSTLSRVNSDKIHATTLQLCQAMKIIDSGIPLVNILQTSMNNALTIVSRRGKDPLTQKGARVANWSTDFGDIAVCMSAQEHLDYEWVKYASNMNLFVKGAVDAAVAMSFNELYQLVQTGLPLTEDNIYRLCDHEYNIQDDGVYMRREQYEQHKDQAAKFAQASRRGWEWAAEHPEETLEIVMKYVRLNHIATNPTLQKLMLAEVLRLQVDRDSGKREFRLRPDMVKLASRLLLENKMLGHEVTYEQLKAE